MAARSDSTCWQRLLALPSARPAWRSTSERSAGPHSSASEHLKPRSWTPQPEMQAVPSLSSRQMMRA
eukprot:1624093-Alexandrium_andersonii.AAC.1